MLGSAIAQAVLTAGVVGDGKVWVANRSGDAGALQGLPVQVTTDPQNLADACEVILFCVPPAAVSDWKIDARGKLVLSVMAGVTRNQLAELSGGARVVRAMSSPAAAQALAYSPWIAGPGVTEASLQTETSTSWHSH